MNEKQPKISGRLLRTGLAVTLAGGLASPAYADHPEASIPTLLSETYCEPNYENAAVSVGVMNESSHDLRAQIDLPYGQDIDHTLKQDEAAGGGGMADEKVIEAGEIHYTLTWKEHDSGDDFVAEGVLRYPPQDCREIGEGLNYKSGDQYWYPDKIVRYDKDDPDTGGGGRNIPSETIAGENRYDTAILVSKNNYGTADTVILATGQNFPDALAGGPLAAHNEAPLLLTPSNELYDGVNEEIDRLGATKAILLGGTTALSQDIENQLRAKGMSVQRLAGENRYETAAMIAEQLPPTERVFLSSGRNFPDALAASVPASRLKVPIILTDPTSLPPASGEYLEDNADTIDIVTVTGGSVAVSASVESQARSEATASSDRLAGEDRYQTAALITEFDRSLLGTVEEIHVATGENFPDALASGPVAALGQYVLVLVHGQDANAGTASYETIDDIKQNDTNEDLDIVVFYGGNSAISSAVKSKVSVIAAS